MTAKLLSIQVGRPREVPWQGKLVQTGIFKDPIKGPVWVRKLNIDGDGQADLSVHGGGDKAVYGYSMDAYPWWLQKLGLASLAPGSFGENLTFSILDETQCFIGDIFRLGGCELQVSEPRFPCFKLAIKFKDPGIIKTFNASGRPGIYFRVRKEGQIRESAALELLVQDKTRLSIREFFDLKLSRYQDKALVRKALSLESLSAAWRDKLRKFS